MKNTQRITPKIPDGMVELLKNLAKSVLKEQPENIYLFAAEYFENLVRERDGSLDKGYSTFRKYDDEIAKRRSVDVCPRCNCVLHPERMDDEKQEIEAAQEDTSPRNDDENANDMSINGVAIKAVPRDGKSSKGTKNRQRLETIRSVSMDSAIEDDGKSPSTSPKSKGNTPKPSDPQMSMPALGALGAVSAVSAVGAVGAVAAIGGLLIENQTEENPTTEQAESIEKDAAPESPVTDAIVESISNTKISSDEDVPDTPTNDTSVSEAYTDRTVIEAAPLSNEAKNDDIDESDQLDSDRKVKENDDATANVIPAVVTESADEQLTNDANDIKSMELTNLQLENVKQMDRLRTPESDSGLSEKSFNLNIQENEDASTNEVNEIKDQVQDNLSMKEKEFDSTSKDDSGIVNVENNQTSEQIQANEKAESNVVKHVIEESKAQKEDTPDANVNDASNLEESLQIEDAEKVEENAQLNMENESNLNDAGSAEKDNTSNEIDPSQMDLGNKSVNNENNPDTTETEDATQPSQFEIEKTPNESKTNDFTEIAHTPKADETVDNILSTPDTQSQNSSKPQSASDSVSDVTVKQVSKSNSGVSQALSNVKSAQSSADMAMNEATDEQTTPEERFDKPSSADENALSKKDDNADKMTSQAESIDESDTNNNHKSDDATLEEIQADKEKNTENQSEPTASSELDGNENVLNEQPEIISDEKLSDVGEDNTNQNEVNANEKIAAKVQDETEIIDANQDAEETQESNNNANNPHSVSMDQDIATETVDEKPKSAASETKLVEQQAESEEKKKSDGISLNDVTESTDPAGEDKKQSENPDEPKGEVNGKLVTDENNGTNQRETMDSNQSAPEQNNQMENSDEKADDVKSINDTTPNEEIKDNNQVDVIQSETEVKIDDKKPNDTTDEQTIEDQENASVNEPENENFDSKSVVSESKVSINSDAEMIENIGNINESNENGETDHVSWKEAADKISEQVAAQDGNQVKVDAPNSADDTDSSADDRISNPAEIISIKNEQQLENAKSSPIARSDNISIQDDLQNTEQNVTDKKNEEQTTTANEEINKNPNETTERNKSAIGSIEDRKSVKSLNETIPVEASESNNHILNESESAENVEITTKFPESPVTSDLRENNGTLNENESEDAIESDEVKPENHMLNEQSKTKLDSTMPDETTDDVYATPPESNTDRSADVIEPKSETNSLASKPDDISSVKSSKMSENNIESKPPEDEFQNEENTKPNSAIIENSKLNSAVKEDSNSIDGVKENETDIIIEHTESHSVDVNVGMENSTMSAEGVDEPDSTNEANVESVNNGSNDDDANANEVIPTVNVESVDEKASIEEDHNSGRNDSDTKSNNNDDVASELSASTKDELYEQAETEIVGDESVKDLDLSSNNDLEPTHTNESEQQTTALEVTTQNEDNDSIDSPKQNQMQPDSDILVDSLDASLEPSVEADSLIIDSLEDKPRSAKSTDTGKLKDAIIDEDNCDINDPSNAKSAQENGNQPSTDETDQTTINKSTLLGVPKEKRKKRDDSERSSSSEMMGDVVDTKSNPDNMHDQMRNELEVLRLAEKSAPIHMLGIKEVDSPLTPKQDQTQMPASTAVESKKNPVIIEQPKDALKQDSESNQPNNEKTEIEPKPTSSIENDIGRTNAEGNERENAETDSTRLSNDSETSYSSNKVPNHELSDLTEADLTEAESKTCVEYLKPSQTSNDTPSSDLSDTDTTDKAEKVYTESGVDETSRDERDEVSEIENFDLSSCGEDSLEAMYYMIRKNEIIMDRSKQPSVNNCEDEKITFPEKATDDLDAAIREVSGKKVKLCPIDSMNSSTDEIVLKKLSSDSDELQLHVIPNSEIDSSSDVKSCPIKEQCTANESTDDEYINPIIDSMRKNENALNEMHAKALSVQPGRCDTQSDDQQLETDTFNEHLIDDMMPGNIERKILASSVSEADSDYFELPPTATNRLTKDDFNVSTAFEHMIRSDSTTEESESTLESAATKIQAGARGFLTRRRIRKSSAGTSASNEKRSSIGNAAIDKSLDNLAEQQELTEETGYSESFDDSSPLSREMRYNNQTIDSIDSDKVLGITEVKVEQRKDDANLAGNDDDKVPEINIEGISEDNATATAQRRLMLQRGDAMQSNSTPESPEQQQADKEKLNKNSNNKEQPTNNNQHEENKHDDSPKIDKALANASKPIMRPLRTIGPRQRSMPVQIDSQLIRVLPKHRKKRVKSASSTSSKKNNLRPQFF